MFAKSKDINELWVPLIEKGLLCANTLDNVHSVCKASRELSRYQLRFYCMCLIQLFLHSNFLVAFADLTAGVCENVDLDSKEEEWPIIQKALSECSLDFFTYSYFKAWLLGCSCSSSTAKAEEDINNTGVIF